MAIRGQRIGDAYVRIHADGSGIGEDIDDHSWRESGEGAGEKFTEGFEKKFDSKRFFDKFHADFSRFADRFEDRWRRIGDTIGNATGRGSRNNFLNFIGSTNRNLFVGLGRLVTILPRIVGGVQNMNREFKALRDLGATFPHAIAGSLNGVFSTISTGLPGLIALAAGFALLVTTAGALVTILSGLLAIVTALAGAIAFALVGALGALLGVLAPVGAAIGVIVAGFVSLDDAQKKVLKNNLKPLVSTFKDLGDAAASHLFRDVGQWAKDLKPLLEGFRPTIVGVADAIRESIGGAIDEAATSPGFARFQRQFNKFLPDAVKSLSDSIFNLGGAMGGVFTALIPITSEFLGWLEDITGEFSAWANSKQGQKELKAFFEDAGDAAKDVGEFLKQATKALAALFDQGQDEGREIFLDMANAMADFVKWASSPEGKKSIDDWLEFGLQLSKELGDMVDAAKDLWDELDTPQNRAFVLWLVGAFTDILNLIKDIAHWWNDFSTDMAVGIANLQDTLTSLKENFGALLSINPIDFFKNPLETLERVASAVSRILKDLTNLPVVGDLFGPAAQGAELFRSGVARLRDAIANLPAVKENLFNRAKNGLDQLLTSLNTLINRIPGVPGLRNIFSNPGEALRNLLKDLGTLISKIPGVPKLPNPFKAAVDAANTLLNILDSIGNFFGRVFSFNIDWPSPPSWLSKLPGLASGGIVSGAQRRLIGEAGPEAVVPLNRPLNLVDPSVRWLSAIAQGMTPVMGGDTSSGTSIGRQITIPEINVVTSVEDPEAVAREVVNIMMGSGY